ncbi:MAG: PqqD family peptide modification chaperone, partial [Clostridiales bacterium]|nr:PqqD family peptide modification chaperone [Clostridiales bacterium]
MIHQYKMNGYNIVMDGNSGAVHAVDPVAYDIISMYENKKKNEIISIILARYEGVTKEDVIETIEEVEELVREQLLFSVDPFEEVAMEFKSKQSVLKALCLHVAHACNMDCKY